MKRTEDIFEFPVNLKLEKSIRGAMWVKVGGVGVVIDESIPDLIAALQQFQKTGTFVPPKRYVVVPSYSIPDMYLIEDTDSDKKLRGSDNFGDFLYLSESKANRIAAILNGEEEE